MISIIDFAKLALYVYKDPTDQKYLQNFIKTKYPQPKEAFHPKNQTQDGFYEILVDPTIQNHTNNEFYASYFVKVENRQAAYSVIAIRGTVFSMLGNVETDVKAWWRTVFDENANPSTPTYFVNQAMNLYRKARAYQTTVLNIPATRCFVTGHSLGGAIAALLPTQCAALVRAVTFDAPGIMGMPDVRNLWDFVINFRAEYDFVSSIGMPVGNQFSYMVPEKAKEALNAFTHAREHAKDPLSRLDLVEDFFETEDFFESVHPQHSMDNLLQVLENSRGINNQYLSVDTFGNLELYYNDKTHQFEQEPIFRLTQGSKALAI